ncbi:hypothetical protein OAS59_02655 [Pelagibacteraceae bacterium]|jgi:hypothetical protein|nr:hypothetical protein [Pelagibacteraceae bacterium]
MKKLVVIIALVLFFSGSANASCQEKLDVNLKYTEFMKGKKFMLVNFKNKSDLNIIITEVGLKSKDGIIMRSEKPDGQVGEDEFYLKPFGISKISFPVYHLNLDVAGKGFYNCRYGYKPATK